MLNEWELGLLWKLHEAVACEPLDIFMVAVTKLGDAGIFWIILALLLLIFKKTRRAGAAMGLSLIFGLVVCNLSLKPLVARTRPYIEDPSITLLISTGSDFSFPSGHTAASFEGAVALFYYHRRLGVFALILAGVIAFSRLYLMVHYPSDVLAGAVLGTVIGYLSARSVSLIKKDAL